MSDKALSSEQTFTEIRDAAGAFVGVTWYHTDQPWLNLAIVLPLRLTIDTEPVPYTAAEVLTLERGRWCEDGRIRHIWLVRDAQRIDQAKGIYVRGATCRTKVGEFCEWIALIVRIRARLAFEGCQAGGTIH